MHDFLAKLKPADIIALVIVIGGYFLSCAAPTAWWVRFSFVSRPTISERCPTSQRCDMFNVENLALAIAEREGWNPLLSQNCPLGSLTYRNHNPGALRSSPFQSGTVGGFSYFKTDFAGWNALIWDLTQKAKGNTVTGLTGESSLRDLIFKWAPASDGNAPELYLSFVCLKTGFAPTMKLKELLK